MKKYNVLIMVLFVVTLVACSTNAPEVLDITPTKNVQEKAESTETSLPTNTLEPTATTPPTETTVPAPEIILGEETLTKNGDFVYRPIEGYFLETRGAQVTMASDNYKVMMSLSVSPPSATPNESVNVLNNFLETLNQDIPDLQATSPETITVAKEEGVSVAVSGEFFDEKMEGLIVVVPYNEKQSFILFGFGMVINGENKWKSEGSVAVSMVLESIEFVMDGSIWSGCSLSDETSYGFTEDNPVKVGGGAFSGPSRERAYLDNLTGPDGQEITYFRNGSLSVNDTVLDIYSVNYSGLAQPVFLYIDEYEFEELLAPVGFICEQPFPLRTP